MAEPEDTLAETGTTEGVAELLARCGPLPLLTPEAFAVRLQELFATVRDPITERRYSVRSVARALSSVGISVSWTHLNHLLAATAGNPSWRHVVGLAWFFRVPVSHFTDELPVAQAQLLQQLLTQDSELYPLLVMITKLPPDPRASLAAMARFLSATASGSGPPVQPRLELLPPEALSS